MLCLPMPCKLKHVYLISLCLSYNPHWFHCKVGSCYSLQALSIIKKFTEPHPWYSWVMAYEVLAWDVCDVAGLIVGHLSFVVLVQGLLYF